MARQWKTIGITARSDITHRDHAVTRIVQVIKACGAKPLLDGRRCSPDLVKPQLKTFASERELDLLIVIGGDGTILRAVGEMADCSVPILSVNRGTVGFLAELTISEVERLLPKFLRGECALEERRLLAITARRGRKILLKGRVLNEAVISQGAISRLIDLETTVNGDALATFHADGVILATPTGSTAYSLAAGGPIVHPGLPATILTPINPHSFSQKPILLPDDQEIQVTILTKQNKFADVQVSLTLDGQTYVTLQGGDTVQARRAKETAVFVRRTEETYFSTLRTKLKWGERL